MELLPSLFASSWAAGVNAYLTVLVLGLFGRLGADSVPDVLSRPDVLAVAGLLALVELVADKVPLLDSAWDALHTFVRPAVGAGLGLLLAGEAVSLEGAATGGLAAVGGVTALVSHLSKSSIRLAVNSSPEPFSNVLVSFVEDVFVAVVVALAVLSPLFAAGLAGILLLLSLLAAFLAFRLVRRGLDRVRSWRASPA